MYMIASAISCLIAIGCLWAGISALIKGRRKRAGSASAPGVVVELQKKSFNPGSGGVYCPTIEFSTPTGEIVRFESSFGTMPASHKVGQAVKVLYDPQKPHTAEIESGLSDWLAPSCFLVFAAGAIFFSIMFLVLFLVLSKGT
jgi:hypothetical protein